jgi:glycosyltransferase involved in cell wall biosynthesis
MISSAHIAAGQALGGAELFYVRLVNALQERREPVLAITSPGGLISRRLRPDVAQEHVPMRGIIDLPSRWRIGAIVRQNQPDIVQTYMGRATRLTHLDRDRHALHVARLGGYYDVKGYRHAHAWVGNTRGICDHLLRSGFPASRIAHIGNFVDTPAAASPKRIAELRRQLDIPEDAIVLLAVGRFHPIKGFADLLTAFHLLGEAPRGRRATLVIVGDGPLQATLRSYACQLGIDRRVRWAGWQLDPQPYYELADLLVCPSHHETLGNVILEAWAHRRAVLATQTVGAMELATDDSQSWTVPAQDPQALSDGMRRLLLDDSLREALATSGRRMVDDHHSQQRIVAAYLEFYRWLVG